MGMQKDRAPLQRVAGLSGVPALLRELGADPHDACAGLSFRPEDLVPDGLIAFDEALQLLANCQRVSGEAHFGLMLGARFDHLSLGPIGQLMQVSPNLGDAIRHYTHVQIGLSRGAAVYSYRLGEDATLGYGIYARHQPGAKHAYDFAMAMAVNIIRSLTGNKANIAEVLICHRPPADPTLFETVLKAKVQFDQFQSCVVFARTDLKLANPQANASRYDALLAQLAAMMSIDAADPAAMLLHRMKPLLMQDACSLDTVARRLNLHPRTLNRRLLSTGSSFVAIRDEVRFRVAQELLALTDLPVGDIASALSFSAHSNFGRAFRRWAGVTPTAWRSSIMAAAG